MNGPDILQTLDMAGYSLFELIASLLWQSSILLAAIGVISYVLRRRNPTIRYMLWVSALAILPFLPIITQGLTALGTPQKEIAVMPDYSPQAKRTAKPAMPHETIPFAHEPVEDYGATGAVEPATTLPQQKVAEEPPAPEMPEEMTPFIETALQYPWAFVLIVYVTGALFFLCWIVIGRLRIRRWIAHGAAVMDVSTFDIFHEAARQLGIDREFLVIESDHAPAPLTCRTLRPVIILPSGLSKELSAEELLSIALHELSHVKRNDVAILSMLSIVKALLFFHPLVWAAIRQVSYLAELSCDARVLELTEASASYAEMLTRIAGNLPKRAMTTELAASFIFSKDMFVDRIRAIIDENHRAIKRLSKLALMTTAAAACLSLVVALAFPLVGENDTAETTATITGTVSQDGRPVSGADVYVIYRSGFYRWDQRGAIASHVKSDRNGEFTIDLPNHLANRQSPYAVVKAIKKGVGACQAPLSGTIQMPHYTLELLDAPSISGKVTDSDGNPVRGVDVSIAGMPELKARTGRNGRYTVSDISADGNMMVFVIGKGYAKSLRNDVYRGMSNVDFTLAPEGRITGHVYHGDSGKLAEGVRLYAVNINFREPSSETVTTDSNGAYTIPNLAAGMYHVTLAVDYDFPETAANAVRNVTVKAGRTTDAVDLTLVEGAVISGTVTDRDTGEALGNVHITAKPDIANVRYYSGLAISGTDGSFKIRCAPGDFGLWAATPPGYVVEQGGRIISASDGGNIDDIHFTFSRGTTVTGRVLKPDGRHAPHVEVSCPIFQGGWQGSVMTDENGRFSIPGLENNKEISIRISDEKNRLSLNTFALIQEGKELELTLEQYSTATVRGRIVNEAGEAVSGVAITYSKQLGFPNDEHRSVHASITSVEAVSDKDGYFTVSGLIAGEKDAYISAEFPGYKPESIAFLEKIAPGETSLEDTVIEKEVADRWLEGYVTDTDGEPVVGVKLSLNDGNTAFSDERGYYRLTGSTQIIVYDLSLYHHDYGFYRFESVPTNERRDITLIKPMYHLTGTVIDGDGNPVPDTRVSIEPWKRKSGFMYASFFTDRYGNFRIKAINDDRIDISFYQHEKGLYKKLEDVAMNQDDLTVTVVKFNREEVEHPLWEFDSRRITFLDDMNAPKLNISQWIQGDGVTLEDLRGKIVVLDFWTSENPKSVEGLTIMKALQKEYGEQDFVILGIHEHTDDIEALRKLLADKGIDYPVAVDGPSNLEGSMGATFDAYGLTPKSYPNMILDHDGNINRDISDSGVANRVTMLMNGEKPYSPASPGEKGPRGKSDDGIWYLNWEEGMAQARRQNKPVIVKFDARRDGEWLSTAMDSLYQSPEIQSKLAEDWVCIKLDIWGPGTASFNGKEMVYNDLFDYFRSNTLATHIFFDSHGTAVQRVMEHILFYNKDHFAQLLDYMRDEYYDKDIAFKDYLASR